MCKAAVLERSRLQNQASWSPVHHPARVHPPSPQCRPWAPLQSRNSPSACLCCEERELQQPEFGGTGWGVTLCQVRSREGTGVALPWHRQIRGPCVPARGALPARWSTAPQRCLGMLEQEWQPPNKHSHSPAPWTSWSSEPGAQPAPVCRLKPLLFPRSPPAQQAKSSAPWQGGCQRAEGQFPPRLMGSEGPRRPAVHYQRFTPCSPRSTTEPSCQKTRRTRRKRRRQELPGEHG